MEALAQWRLAACWSGGGLALVCGGGEVEALAAVSVPRGGETDRWGPGMRLTPTEEMQIRDSFLVLGHAQ